MKLVTWNTQSCTGLDGETSPPRIVREARALADFDVLCLQEIAVNYPGLTGGVAQDQVAQLSALLPGYQLFFGASVDEAAPDGGRRRFGNLVASRLPVAQVQHHPLPCPAAGGVPSIPRMCTVATVLDPGLGPVRVMTTHLEYYAPAQRLAQAHALRALHLEYAAQAGTPPLPIEDGSAFGAKALTREAVLCGDFNLAPGTREYGALTEASDAGTLWDAWRLVHGGAPHPPTFCVHEQKYLPRPVACDFMFVSDGLRHRVRQVVADADSRASDHQPLALALSD